MAAESTPAGLATAQPRAMLLVVCDFDHTLINVNSDLVLFNELSYGQPLLPRFASLRQEHAMGWTQIMQSQLAELATARGYCKTDVLKCLHDVKMDPILISALQKLNASQIPAVKLIIASDSNTIFINEILKANAVPEGTFALVYTNDATWTTADAIQVEPYQPLSSPHQCPRSCPANMCKTTIVQRARKALGLESAQQLQTVYIGDGGNDFCPSLSLSVSDLVLVRDGLALQRLIDNATTADNESEGQGSRNGPETGRPLAEQVIAQTKTWKTQCELGEMLLQLVSQSQVDAEERGNEKDAVQALSQRIEMGLSF
ncbi:uncharacterized protein A1O9_12622 [Exophiala aquamarina CBS 119918]|uniref:Pyridoxal phosphate phosphatase PHOSPHO2 n=1 Tax=Exophiala aquamarina CBS 119918 TaxID=1182545 RepID=A0A072NV79_9EURO|nr:uncharacterized protein A1O9_12622 [Exophiala aquamarina CBS 119918]KEF51272.1 hypothetical protein A1O9_12622 [Exophiala aquamarina CBS 119918]